MDYRVDFEALPWESPMAGVQQKAVSHGGWRLRLVEFAGGFVEPGWCAKGHFGYVLAGELEVAFDGRSVTFRQGDGIVIPAGEEHRHKATVLSDVFRAVLVEDM